MEMVVLSSAMGPKAENIEEYFSWFPPEIQNQLGQIRKAIKEVLPEATEVISYHMPAFKTTEVLVYYAAMKNHIGFYPAPEGMEEFDRELTAYKKGKGSVQFPFDQPIPFDLIARITAFRVKQNSEKKK